MVVPDVWLNPIDQQQQARAARARLTMPDGAHITLLNVYNQYVQSVYPVNEVSISVII